MYNLHNCHSSHYISFLYSYHLYYRRYSYCHVYNSCYYDQVIPRNYQPSLLSKIMIIIHTIHVCFFIAILLDDNMDVKICIVRKHVWILCVSDTWTPVSHVPGFASHDYGVEEPSMEFVFFPTSSKQEILKTRRIDADTNPICAPCMEYLHIHLPYIYHKSSINLSPWVNIPSMQHFSHRPLSPWTCQWMALQVSPPGGKQSINYSTVNSCHFQETCKTG